MTKVRSFVPILSLVGALALALTACTATTPKKDVSNVTAGLDYVTGTVVLPLDPFLSDKPEFSARISEATSALVNSCLSAQGLPVVPKGDKPIDQAVMENREFGQWSVSLASKYGTGIPPVSNKSAAGGNSAAGTDSPQYNQCLTQAKEKLANVFNYLQTVNIDYRIKDDAHQLTLESAAGKDAMEARAKCIENRGVTLDPTRSMESDQYRDQSPEAQIEVAVAVAECAVETGAIKTLFDLEAQYQTELMQDNEAALNEHQAKLAELGKKLDDVIRDGVVSP